MKLLIGIIIIVIASILGAFGSLYLKKGSKKFELSLKILKNKEFLLGVLLYGISTIMFIPALKFGPVNLLYPMTSQVYIWTGILAVYMLKEKFNKLKILGNVLIILGIILMLQ